jgi:tRNA G18 (ribose-2'-O)-methylase SpoU
VSVRVEIDDPDDPQVADYLGLRDHQLRMRRERPGGDRAHLFVTEGDLVVERALRAGHRLKSLLVDGARRSPLPASVPDDVPVYAAGPLVLERITGYHLHRGVLAVFHRGPEGDPAAVLAGARSAVVLENVVNPTNLGVIIRSAAGLGIDAVLLDPTCADPLYRRASRVAMGEVFALPWARLPTFPAGLDTVRTAGFTILALTPTVDAVAVDDLVLPRACRPALVLGSEGPGLPDGTMGAADVRVRIPMARGVDSLNVGAAAAVAMWAVLHARR